MRTLRSSLLFTLSLCATTALAAPGYEWEMKMEMEGMPMAMPAQRVCSPQADKEPPVTREDGDCKLVDKKVSGNRFQWKAVCKEGTATGDITSTPTSYQGTMTMTDKSGQTTRMKMAGKRLGNCDYQPGAMAKPMAAPAGGKGAPMDMEQSMKALKGLLGN